MTRDLHPITQKSATFNQSAIISISFAEREEERKNRAEPHEAGLLGTCGRRKGGYADAEREPLEELVEGDRGYERFKVGARGERESEPDDERVKHDAQLQDL